MLLCFFIYEKRILSLTFKKSSIRASLFFIASTSHSYIDFLLFFIVILNSTLPSLALSPLCCHKSLKYHLVETNHLVLNRLTMIGKIVERI